MLAGQACSQVRSRVVWRGGVCSGLARAGLAAVPRMSQGHVHPPRQAAEVKLALPLPGSLLCVP